MARELIQDGLSAADAERWCRAWEAEACRRPSPPEDLHFWDAGRGWIDAQRSFEPAAPAAVNVAEAEAREHTRDLRETIAG